MPARVVNIPKQGVRAKFVMPRDEMRKGHPKHSFFNPFVGTQVPAVTLPNDRTKNPGVSCPMDGNDQYGDCMYAMALHCDNVWTYMLGNGTESVFDQNTIIKDYLALAGGDNGLDEGTLLGGWEGAGLCSNPAVKVVDSLDIDVTDSALARFAIDQGFFVCLMWSVPDDFIQNFQTGASFLTPGIPDPNNGHGTPLIDVNADGNFRLWTWGGWCWVSPSFVASVQPGAFVVFSTRGFDPKTGLDAKGVHISVRAQSWTTCGGKVIDPAVINAFPPAPAPGPTPTPPVPPVPPTPGPTPTPTGNVLTLLTDLAAGTYSIGGGGGLSPVDAASLQTAITLLSTINAAGKSKAEINWPNVIAALKKAFAAFCAVAPSLPIPAEYMVWIQAVCAIENPPPAPAAKFPDGSPYGTGKSPCGSC